MEAIEHVLSKFNFKSLKETQRKAVEGYYIYSIKRPGRLFHFWTFRVGAYLRLGAY